MRYRFPPVVPRAFNLWIRGHVRTNNCLIWSPGILTSVFSWKCRREESIDTDPQLELIFPPVQSFVSNFAMHEWWHSKKISHNFLKGDESTLFFILIFIEIMEAKCRIVLLPASLNIHMYYTRPTTKPIAFPIEESSFFFVSIAWSFQAIINEWRQVRCIFGLFAASLASTWLICNH